MGNDDGCSNSASCMMITTAQRFYYALAGPFDPLMTSYSAVFSYTYTYARRLQAADGSWTDREFVVTGGSSDDGGTAPRHLAALPAAMDGDAYPDVGEGVTFTLQRDARGSAALGSGASGQLGAGGLAQAFGLRFDTVARNLTQSTFGFIGAGTGAPLNASLPEAGEYNVSLASP